MIDCGDDEAGIRERRCRVMMAAEPAGVAVRENDQRQLCACDGTILHADQTVIDGHSQIAEIDMFRLALARIPDGARQAWTVVEKLDARSVGGRGKATENDNANPKCVAQPNRLRDPADG